MVWVKTYKKNVKLGMPKYVKIVRHKIVKTSNCEPAGYRAKPKKRCKPVRCKPVKKKGRLRAVTDVVTSSLTGLKSLDYTKLWKKKR